MLCKPTSEWHATLLRIGVQLCTGITCNFGPEYTEAEKRFNTEEIAYQAEHSALRQKMKRAASQGASLDPLKTEFEKLEINKPPTEKRYETQSVTVEKLHELICENQHGLLVLVDELVRLFKTWEKPGHEADRAFFMEGWTGGQPFTSDTIGRGTLHTPCLTISLVGGIQPDKLQRFLLDAANGDDDGFPQRLQLAVFPDSKAWQYIDETPDVEAIRRIQQLVQSLDGLDYKKIGADFDTAGKYHFFRFSIEANDVFRRWITCLETEKIAKETNNLVRGHLAKYRSLMPSLALAFCLIRVSDLIAKGQDVSATITGDDAQNASNFCNYLESHARKIYALVDDAKQRATYALSRKITQGVLPNLFSLRDVYRNNWRNLGDKELVRAGCDGLIVMGWLREIEIPPGPEGGGPSTRFQINPKILFEEKKENG